MAKKKKGYTADSINALTLDVDRVRKRPGIYIPDNKLRGAVHLYREAKDNSDDEIYACHIEGEEVSNVVECYFDESTGISKVQDYGRGIPHEKLRVLCEVLNSSGKFDKEDEDSPYRYAGGENGVGLKLINFLSDYMIVSSTRDGIKYTVYYEDGKFKSEEKEKAKKSQHGTYTEWKLSGKYMKELNKLKCNHIVDMIKTKAECCPNVVTHMTGLTKKGEPIDETYVGLTPQELILLYNEPTSSIQDFETKEKDLETNIAFAYDAKATEGYNILSYFNFIKTISGGRHADALVDALQEHFKKYFNDTLSEKEKKTFTLKKEDVRLGLCGVVIVRSTIEPEFKGQVKEELGSEKIYNRVYKAIKEQLKLMPNKFNLEYGSILKNNVKARLNSVKARADVKKVGNRISGDHIENYLTKSPMYKGDYLEIYVTEGLSAGHQVKSAGHPFQEVYKLRGRVTNVMDFSLDKLQKDDTVKELSRILELPIGSKKKGIMKHGALKILTDADVDGLAIQTGMTVICAKAFPEIIDEGKLFVVVPPLYSFKDYNNETRFATNNREYLEYIKEQFSVENKLYINDRELTDEQMGLFLDRNERYAETLKMLADDAIIPAKLMELIMSHVKEFGYDKDSISKWDSMLSKYYSKQLHASYDDGVLTIEGIKKGEYSIVHINKDFMESDRTKNFIEYLTKNMNDVLNYSIRGKYNEDNISINRVFKIMSKYKGKGLHRFKGLGEMSVDELRDYVMDLEIQKCKQITWGDVDKSMRTITSLHSRKPEYIVERKVLMKSYKPDIMDIDT